MKKMKRIVWVVFATATFLGTLAAQSTAYVLNFGPTIGTQRWDNSDRQLLFKYHAAISIESVENENDRSSLFAQFGYHVKGSANRFTFLNQQGGGISNFTEEYRFNNLSMLLGAKQKFPIGLTGRGRYFFSGGIRLDYTLNTNIDDLAKQNPFWAIYYPQIGFMNRWMFGVTIGGGLEFKLSELIGGQLHLTVNPDLTNQYSQPPIYNVINPNPFPGQPSGTTTIPEQRIRNTSLEISIGLRLLRKVEYVED